MSDRRKSDEQVALKQQHEDKLEHLNSLLREGKVGPHKFDQDFNKIWSEVVGADDHKGWNKPRLVSQSSTAHVPIDT
eukprot:CAMPEP_0183337054 /NCGR_PEP_ID=MMETSP0164_2-20130417/4852_1 /TAXON_ID=221442 /ORGANISM="Coccolithus pelagicus ssp braarudi, Strain PLY182g" /LENGTH=76 /DNA_ID=CAMNT_0025506697 /DNA_START=45 /DNA_END=275 /DNA_ORIENTATION=+